MKEIKNKNFTDCPNCGEKATIESLVSVVLGTTIAFTMLLCVIGLFIWILIPLVPVVFIAGLIVTFLCSIKGGATIKCNNCKTKFRLSKVEYKEYKEALK